MTVSDLIFMKWAVLDGSKSKSAWCGIKRDFWIDMFNRRDYHSCVKHAGVINIILTLTFFSFLRNQTEGRKSMWKFFHLFFLQKICLAPWTGFPGHVKKKLVCHSRHKEVYVGRTHFLTDFLEHSCTKFSIAVAVDIPWLPICFLIPVAW